MLCLENSLIEKKIYCYFTFVQSCSIIATHFPSEPRSIKMKRQNSSPQESESKRIRYDLNENGDNMNVIKMQYDVTANSRSDYVNKRKSVASNSNVRIKSMNVKWYFMIDFSCWSSSTLLLLSYCFFSFQHGLRELLIHTLSSLAVSTPSDIPYMLATSLEICDNVLAYDDEETVIATAAAAFLIAGKCH